MDAQKLMKAAGIKNTKHRQAILLLISASDKPLTAEDVFMELKAKDVSIWLSTVYRTLEFLTEKGIVIKSTIMSDNKARYEANRHEHKHYVICKSCNKMQPILKCPFEAFEKSILEQMNFWVTGHKFEIYGYCQECREQN